MRNGCATRVPPIFAVRSSRAGQAH
jgi:hypothetical protein